MNIVYLNEHTPSLPPCVATIGFFDGVHLGHLHLIEEVVRQAATSHLAAALITFDVHPRSIVHADKAPLLLTTLDTKLQLLAQTAVDSVVVLPFTPALAALSAHDFMETILKNRLNVRTLVIGYDNKFGHQREKGFEDYVQYGRELGIEVLPAPPFDTSAGRAASSTVRRCLQQGDVATAARLLGRPYRLEGKVVHGYQEGRKLGFPTANIAVQTSNLLVPAGGVYAVKVYRQKDNTLYDAMLSIGNRPTYGVFERSIEAHIFNFSQDIYDETVALLFIERLRDEQKFDSLEALRQQLAADRLATEKILANHSAT